MSYMYHNFLAAAEDGSIPSSSEGGGEPPLPSPPKRKHGDADASTLLDPAPRGSGQGPTLDSHTEYVANDDHAEPVLLMHGWRSYSYGGWSPLIKALRTTYLGDPGFQTIHRVGYYGAECGADLRVEHHGSHNRWFGGEEQHSTANGCNGHQQIHNAETDIRHLAYHFAWGVYDHYASNGQGVDVIAHSMGGLILRYAYFMIEVGHEHWPPFIYIEDAITMGTPHRGHDFPCVWQPNDQAEQMCSGSDFMEWLYDYAERAEISWLDTEWSLFISECDGFISPSSGTAMDKVNKYVYLDNHATRQSRACFTHSEYYKDASLVEDAHVRITVPGPGSWPDSTWTDRSYWRIGQLVHLAAWFHGY